MAVGPLVRARARARVEGGDERGATLVEFALVAPLVFLLIFGIIAGCYFAFQDSSLHDGATAGARAASIESSLVSFINGQYCESGKTSNGQAYSIEQAIGAAAPVLQVNPAPLCNTATVSSDTDVTTLTQTPTVPGDVNITVTCGGSCAVPTSLKVALSVTTQGLVAPFNMTYTLNATSQVPTVSP